MNNSYPKLVDITADLVGGDVELDIRRQDGGDNNRYNLLPRAIMVNHTAAAISAVKVLTSGGDGVTLQLQNNVIYEIDIRKIIKTGTTTSAIIILGDVN